MPTLADDFIDLTDEFFKSPVEYHHITQQKDDFSAQQASIFIIKGLNIPNKTGEDSRFKIITQGIEDFSEGYILFNRIDLETVNLIDSQGVIHMNNYDYFYIEQLASGGKQRYEIIGINQVAPDFLTRGQFVLLKVHYKKILQSI